MRDGEGREKGGEIVGERGEKKKREMGREWESGKEKEREGEGERDDASWKESYSFSGIHQNSKILFGFPAKIDCRLFVIDLS